MKVNIALKVPESMEEMFTSITGLTDLSIDVIGQRLVDEFIGQWERTSDFKLDDDDLMFRVFPEIRQRLTEKLGIDPDISMQELAEMSHGFMVLAPLLAMMEAEGRLQ